MQKFLEKLTKKFNKIFYKDELNRLRVENDHLVDYNKKLENHVRLKSIEIKKLQKRIKEFEKR